MSGGHMLRRNPPIEKYMRNVNSLFLKLEIIDFFTYAAHTFH